jgi:hypothetical protein
MNLRNPKPRPWFRIIRDLMAANVSMSKISRICGKSCARVVQHWCDGGEPKDTDARIVLELYRRHCPEQYLKHMQEFEPEMLNMNKAPVLVEADRSIRGRPRPNRVLVYRTPAGMQDDLFEEVPC